MPFTQRGSDHTALSAFAARVAASAFAVARRATAPGILASRLFALEGAAALQGAGLARGGLGRDAAHGGGPGGVRHRNVDGKRRARRSVAKVRLGAFAHRSRPTFSLKKKKCRRFVRRGYALRSHEGRERTTRRSPRAAADDADRRATRRSSANASRCASVASRDAPRDVRGIPRLRSRSPKSRLGAVASERERSPETRKRTLYAPGLGRLHLAGGPVGSGGAEVTGRGQLRLAKRAPRGVARPMRDVGIVMADVKREARGCRIDARASHATRPFHERTWRSRTPCRPRGRRTWSWRTCLFGGVGG